MRVGVQALVFAEFDCHQRQRTDSEDVSRVRLDRIRPLQELPLLLAMYDVRMISELEGSFIDAGEDHAAIDWHHGRWRAVGDEGFAAGDLLSVSNKPYAALAVAVWRLGESLERLEQMTLAIWEDREGCGDLRLLDEVQHRLAIVVLGLRWRLPENATTLSLLVDQQRPKVESEPLAFVTRVQLLGDGLHLPHGIDGMLVASDAGAELSVIQRPGVARDSAPASREAG